MARKERKKNLCRHMTSYGECTLTEEPCVQGPCSLEEPEEWVQVVRCKYCKWGQPDKLLNKYLCTRVFGCMKVREDDFCSCGRRRRTHENLHSR